MVKYFNLDSALLRHQTHFCGTKDFTRISSNLIEFMRDQDKFKNVPLVICTGRRNLQEMEFDKIFTNEFWQVHMELSIIRTVQRLNALSPVPPLKFKEETMEVPLRVAADVSV